MALPDYMEILFFILMLLLVGIQYKQYFYFQVRSKFPWARDALAQQMRHRAATQDQYYLPKQSKTNSAKVDWKMHDPEWGTYRLILFDYI